MPLFSSFCRSAARLRLQFVLPLLMVLSALRRFNDEQFILRSVGGAHKAKDLLPQQQRGRHIHTLARGNDVFVVGEAELASKMHERPSLVHRGPPQLHNEFVADIVSIGSETRVIYLKAQIQTWAAHVNIRHVWGFTESQDYDSNCASAMNGTVAAYLNKCRSTHEGWDAEIDEFVVNRFAQTDRGLRQDPGWLCAQRRVGRAMGWVHSRYRNEEVDALPDVLIFVDDDTAVNVGNAMDLLTQAHIKDNPSVGAGCYYNKANGRGLAIDGFPFAIPHGGFGTFFNKRAIKRLTRPIFCNGEKGSKNGSVCTILRENRIGELDAFREGMSILELFYWYSALRNFCLHSDWAVGFMIGHYLHPLDGADPHKPGDDAILRMNPPGPCANFTGDKAIPCTDSYSSCHGQTPRDMENLALTFFMKSPASFHRIPRLNESSSGR